MKLCKTCKHWGGPAKHGGAEHGRPLAECQHPKTRATSLDLPWPEDGAGDAEEWTNILTGPNFGCVHHEFSQDG